MRGDIVQAFLDHATAFPYDCLVLYGLILGRGVEEAQGGEVLVTSAGIFLPYFLFSIALSVSLWLWSCTPISQTLTFYQCELFYISPHVCFQNFCGQHHSFFCFWTFWSFLTLVSCPMRKEQKGCNVLQISYMSWHDYVLYFKKMLTIHNSLPSSQ